MCWSARWGNLPRLLLANDTICVCRSSLAAPNLTRPPTHRAGRPIRWGIEELAALRARASGPGIGGAAANGGALQGTTWGKRQSRVWRHYRVGASPAPAGSCHMWNTAAGSGRAAARRRHTLCGPLNLECQPVQPQKPHHHSGGVTLLHPPAPSALYVFKQVLQLHPSLFLVWHPTPDTLHCASGAGISCSEGRFNPPQKSVHSAHQAWVQPALTYPSCAAGPSDTLTACSHNRSEPNQELHWHVPSSLLSTTHSTQCAGAPCSRSRCH